MFRNVIVRRPSRSMIEGITTADLGLPDYDLALRQQPGRVPIYRSESSRQYGISRAILGEKLPSGYAVAELERSVRETASFCPAVREIQDFSATRRGRTCQVSFTAVLYTEETVEVSVDV